MISGSLNELLKYLNDKKNSNDFDFPEEVKNFNIDSINPYYPTYIGTPSNPNPLAFYIYCKTFLGFDQKNNPNNKWDDKIHGWWCICLQADLMEKGYLRDIYELPRGTLKTTIKTYGLITWAILLNPNIRVLLGSDTDSTATQLLVGISYILQGKTSAYWKYWIGDLSEGASIWNKSTITINRRTSYEKEPTLTAAGTHTNLVSAHYDYIHLDDPVNLNDFWMSKIRENRLMWFTASLYLLEPHVRNGVTGYCMIGTPWNEYDLYNEIEKSQLNEDNTLLFGKDCFIVHKSTSFHEDDTGKRILHYPKILSHQELKIREHYANMQHPLLFWSQYQMMTRLPEQKMFSIDIFDKFAYRYFEFEESYTGRSIIAIDPAGGKSKESDYTSICVILEFTKSNETFYGIQEIHLTRAPIETHTDIIYSLMKKYHINVFHYEGTGNLEAYGKLIKELIMNKYNVSLYQDIMSNTISALPIKSQGNKEMRISSLQYPFKIGLLRVLSPSERNQPYNEAIKQFIDFVPVAGANKHDDAPDSVQMAFKKIYRQNKNILSSFLEVKK